MIKNTAPYPAFAIDSSTYVGVGWNGPYLTSGSSSIDFTLDAWGQAILYDPAATPPTLTSLGADQAPGGSSLNQDIVVTLPLEQSIATVQGFVCKNAGPFSSDAEVELNFPNGLGVLKQSLLTIAPAANGYFEFASIPMGVRSITVYVPSKAAPTKTIGPIQITVAQQNYRVPCNLIDVGP